MPGLVEQRSRQVLRRLEALIEFLGGQHLVEKLGRHGRTRFMVLRVVLQDLRPGRPHLIDLRRILHEIARHARATEAGILHVRKHAVQGVAKLVKCRPDFIVGQQGRLARGRLGNIEMIGHDRLRPKEPALRNVLIHPGAAAFRRTGVVIHDKYRERFPVFVGDLERANLGQVNGQVFPFLEGDAVEFGRREEDAVNQDVV